MKSCAEYFLRRIFITKEKYKEHLYLILIAENKEVVRFYEKMNFQTEEGAVPMAICHF